MLEAYSLNVEVAANTAIPFNNISLKKCSDAVLSGVSTIQLNKCGVYKVCCNASSAASATIQLYKNGVAQPQAQSTGTSNAFTTLVQVPTNNCGCPCSSPVEIQVLNTGDASATFTDANITVEKIA